MQYTFESDWFLYNVGLYLTPVDLYNLKHVTKGTYREIKRKDIDDNIIRRIHRRLRELLRDKYDLFIEYMGANPIVMSGLFLMQCILGEEWKITDIQIDIEVYAYMDYYDNNFFDILKTNNDIYKPKKPFTLYENVIDYVNVYDARIRPMFISPKKTNSFNIFKKYVANIFDLSICKNIFQIENGKNILQIYNFTNLVNRTDFIIADFINNNEIVMECMERCFDIKAKLTMDPCIKYSMNKMPFMVYKNNKDKFFEKLTFLNKVMDKNDIIKCIENQNGDVIINITPEKCKKIKDVLTFKINLKEVFNMCLKNYIDGNVHCNCHLRNLFFIPHYHWRCDTYNMKKNNVITNEFLIIDYRHLDKNMIVGYSDIF